MIRVTGINQVVENITKQFSLKRNHSIYSDGMFLVGLDTFGKIPSKYRCIMKYDDERPLNPSQQGCDNAFQGNFRMNCAL